MGGGRFFTKINDIIIPWKLSTILLLGIIFCLLNEPYFQLDNFFSTVS